MSEQPLWAPSPERVSRSHMTAFMKLVNERHGLQLRDYAALQAWSVANLEQFWVAVWDYGGVIGERGERVLVDAGKMPGARFFPDAKLNFAENLLRHRHGSDALVFWGEDKVRRRLSGADLHEAVSRMQQAFAAAGVGEGDRVAAFMPNMPETLVAMLAAASLGATFTSCSPDFGVQGVLDRFGQVEPKVLVCCDGYYYNGKVVETLARIAEVAKQLPSAKRVVVVPYVTEKPQISGVPRAVLLEQFLAHYEPMANRVQADAVQPSALYPVLERHHRRSQVHRARRGRRAAAAPEGAPAARRPQAGRPALLLHDLRLDDVELARVGARGRRGAAPLRRIALRRARPRALRPRGRRAT